MKRRLLMVLALALLAIPAASPFLLPNAPRTNDLPAHLFRTFFFIRAVEWGGVWPRWSPDLVYGYGYPVFNFFPSLFHWVLALLHKTGLPLFTAYRVHIYLLFWLTAVSSHLFALKIFKSRAAGWTAALIYTYSPYLLYDAHVRGSGPELQALALLPLLILLLWQISDGGEGQLLQKADFLKVAATAVIFAIIFLSHPIAYQLLIPLGVWLLIKAGFAWRNSFANGRFFNALHTLIPPIVGIGLGGLLVAFYWLPAFIEVNHTRANQSISQGYAYQTNFLSLLDMVRWPQLPADPALINPSVVRALPIMGLVWTAVFILWRWRKMERWSRETVAAWTAVLLFSIWLITPYSVFVWDNFPLLRLTFYPWRLLGMASMSIAILAAVVTCRLPLANLQTCRLQTLLLTALVIISSIPWLYPPRTVMPEKVDLPLAMSDELPPYIVGTTTFGEFLPEWIEELPPTEPLRDDLRVNGNPDRLQAQDGLIWEQHNDNPIKATYTITANRPLTITYRQFYFPGWTARLDGEERSITPSSPHGLIAIAAPVGVHELSFTFGTTTARIVGTAVSAIAAIILIVLAASGEWRVASGEWRGVRDGVSASFLLAMAILLLVIWLFFTVVDTPLRRPTLLPDGVAGKPSVMLDYAGEIRLLSVEQSAAEYASDEWVDLTLYWQAQRNIGASYNVGIQVVDEEGVRWSAESTRPFDWRFIGRDLWPLERYRMDPYLIRLMDGTPPGRYFIHVGLVNVDTGGTIAAHPVAEFVVDEAATGAELTLEEGMHAAEETAVSQNLHLLGSRLDRAEAAPGDPARVTTLWHITGAMGDLPTLQLVSDDGDIVLEQPIPLAADAKPSDRLRAENIIRLPAATPDGTHHWRVLWGSQSVNLGELTVTAPERTFELPDMGDPINTPFYTPDGKLFATLLATRHSPLALIWRAEMETAVSYRIYMHLVDVDSNILAQSDGEPAQWSRPTTGWLPGEIILDTHDLSMVDGASALHIGLYDPETGERLDGETVLWLEE